MPGISKPKFKRTPPRWFVTIRNKLDLINEILARVKELGESFEAGESSSGLVNGQEEMVPEPVGPEVVIPSESEIVMDTPVVKTSPPWEDSWMLGVPVKLEDGQEISQVPNLDEDDDDVMIIGEYFPNQ